MTDELLCVFLVIVLRNSVGVVLPNFNSTDPALSQILLEIPPSRLEHEPQASPHHISPSLLTFFASFLPSLHNFSPAPPPSGVLSQITRPGHTPIASTQLARFNAVLLLLDLTTGFQTPNPKGPSQPPNVHPSAAVILTLIPLPGATSLPVLSLVTFKRPSDCPSSASRLSIYAISPRHRQLNPLLFHSNSLRQPLSTLFNRALAAIRLFRDTL